MPTMWLFVCRQPETACTSYGDLNLFTFLLPVRAERGVHQEDPDAWLWHEGGHSCAYSGGTWLCMTWAFKCHSEKIRLCLVVLHLHVSRRHSNYILFHIISTLTTPPYFPGDPQSGERAGSAVVGGQWGAPRWAGCCCEEHGLAPPTSAGTEGHPA